MAYYVHPERYSLSNMQRPRLLIVHTSEGGELSTSDDQLIEFMGRPGDRIIPGSNPPRPYGAAYHAVADGDNETWHEGPGDAYGVYAAGGANKFARHICHPGRVSQTREQWLDPRSRGQIKGVAKWLVRESRRLGIPLRKLTPAQVKAGESGYCGHNDVRILGLTDHTDPEPNYPWDVLALDIWQIVNPTPVPVPTPDPPTLEEHSVFKALIKHPGHGAVYALYSGGYKTWIPNGSALERFVYFQTLAGNDTTIIVCDTTTMEAFGPIDGPIPPPSTASPAGVNGFGVPL